MNFDENFPNFFEKMGVFSLKIKGSFHIFHISDVMSGEQIIAVQV